MNSFTSFGNWPTGRVRKEMTPKEYVRAVGKNGNRDRISTVEFVPPKLGRSGDMGKFVVVFK